MVLYSAAVDLKSGGNKLGGGVKHRVMVTGIDPAENAVTTVAASTFGGRTPGEYHAAQGHGWRRQYEYLAFEPSTSPLPEYEVVETDLQVVTGWVNYLRQITIRYSGEARHKLCVIPKTLEVPTPYRHFPYHAVSSPDWTTDYMSFLRGVYVRWRTDQDGLADLKNLAIEASKMVSWRKAMEKKLWDEVWAVSSLSIVLTNFR